MVLFPVLDGQKLQGQAVEEHGFIEHWAEERDPISPTPLPSPCYILGFQSFLPLLLAHLLPLTQDGQGKAPQKLVICHLRVE